MNNFEEVWNLKPKDLSNVYVYNKEKCVHERKQIFRSYRSYLCVPPFNPDLKKSYMFDGLEESVPNCLLPYLRKTWKEDDRYNQMIVNWYEPEDYIQPHRDCDHYMVDDYEIKIYSLGDIRNMIFEHVDSGHKYEKLLSTPLTITKEGNRGYRHSVGSGRARRISITFRMLDMEKM